VQLHSFGCGIDALTTGTVREILQRANKSYTALKLDEMVDLSSIRIRLRSLAYALNHRAAGQKQGHRDGSCVPVFGLEEKSKVGHRNRPYVPVSPRVILPALAPEYLKAIQTALAAEDIDFTTLEPISQQDLESGLLHLNNDLCHQMLSIGGQVVNWVLSQKAEAVRAEQTTVLIPKFCFSCRGLELEYVIRQALKAANIDGAISIEAIPSDGTAAILSIKTAEVIYGAIEAVDAARGSECDSECGSGRDVGRKRGRGRDSGSSGAQTRVGVIGNPAMLYTPELNNGILARIAAEGCVPVTPPLTELLLTNAPLQRSLPQMVGEGIRDFVYVQSFGCLSAHIHDKLWKPLRTFSGGMQRKIEIIRDRKSTRLNSSHRSQSRIPSSA
jgi:hypothetical protein